MPKSLSPIIQKQLGEISSEPVGVWISRGDGICEIGAELPHVPVFTGESSKVMEDRQESLFLYEIKVPKALRRRGIATRLMGSMAYAAKQEGFDELKTSTHSRKAMGLLRKLFGETHIHIFDIPDNDTALVELPMTVDQAIESMRRAKAAKEPLDYVVKVELGSFDLSETDRPLINRQP